MKDSSFATWLLVESKDSNITRYNKGFKDQGVYTTTLGFFHTVYIGQPEDVICLIKPIHTFEQQQDATLPKAIFGVGISHFNKTAHILAKYIICNN